MTMLNVNDTIQQTRDDQKFVSIIIPTFNESMNIRDLLNQIQTHIPAETNVEIIIVDDNSPDGTGHIVEKYIEEKMNLKDYDIKTESQSTSNWIRSFSWIPIAVACKYPKLPKIPFDKRIDTR